MDQTSLDKARFYTIQLQDSWHIAHIAPVTSPYTHQLLSLVISCCSQHLPLPDTFSPGSTFPQEFGLFLFFSYLSAS